MAKKIEFAEAKSNTDCNIPVFITPGRLLKSFLLWLFLHNGSLVKMKIFEASANHFVSWPLTASHVFMGFLYKSFFTRQGFLWQTPKDNERS